MFSWLRRDFKKLGPGLITGASDDDPSGIATYSQAGAGFGFSTLWGILLTLPLMIAVQEMCARIAIVTKRGLVANIRRRHSRPFVFWVVLSFLIANVINIGADLGMMASAIQLLIPSPFFGVLLIVGLLTLSLQIFIPYHTYARVLKWLTLSLLAYVGVALTISIHWGEALRSTVLPVWSWNKNYLLIIVALLGATISPYLYFWQASQEVEESHETDGVYGKNHHSLWRKLKAMRFDVGFGMTFSNIVAWFIVVSAAVVLDGHGYV
ncbi:divalent metal cation transporter [Candidatus Uhrbacteria bacterium]|nr:divalent metal cation transporter [Candidatus Uhrbacteria bacterium]